MKLLLSVLSLAILITSCQPKDRFDKDSIEKEVHTMLKAYDDAVRAKGLDGEFDFLDDSDEFYWVPPGYKYAITYDSVATILRQTAPRLSHVDNEWDTLRIQALSKNYASFSGVVKSMAVTSKGDTIRMKLAETGLVVRRKTGWKLLSGQTTVIR